MLANLIKTKIQEHIDLQANIKKHLRKHIEIEENEKRQEPNVTNCKIIKHNVQSY